MPVTKRRKDGKVDRRCHPKWKDEYHFVVYRMAREGCDHRTIAEGLSVTLETFSSWLKVRPALRAALTEGKKDKFDWPGYAYRRLPQRWQRIWDKLCAVEKGSPIEVVETILGGQDAKVRRYLWVHALACGNFKVDYACEIVGVSRSEVERWKEEDPDFCQAVADLMLMKKDFCEGSLMDLVAGRDVAATIFANKALNSDRGYNPTKKMEVRSDQTLLVEVRNLQQLDAETLRKLDLAMNQPKELSPHEVEVR